MCLNYVEYISEGQTLIVSYAFFVAYTIYLIFSHNLKIYFQLWNGTSLICNKFLRVVCTFNYYLFAI